MSDAIVVEGLVKCFGATTALDGVHLTVAEGSVLGLLGPNGAGKTTVVRILTTLLRADAGRVRVAGLDVVQDADAVRASIRSEEHTSELQSRQYLVCRLLLEKKKQNHELF